MIFYLLLSVIVINLDGQDVCPASRIELNYQDFKLYLECENQQNDLIFKNGFE